MDKPWTNKYNTEELEGLKKERQYIIFIPDPENHSNFATMIADTTTLAELIKSSDDIELDYDEKHPNISMVVIKGIMHMLAHELDYLVDKGEEMMYDEYMESITKDEDNVIMFKPKKGH